MKENSIEDRINNAYCFLNSMHSDFRTGLYYKEDLENLDHILSDYKRVLKENEKINSFKKKLEKDSKEQQWIQTVDDEYLAYTEEQEDSIYAIKFAVMQQQIDKLKRHNNNLLRKLRNRVKEVKKLQKYSLYKEEFSRLNKQLQNKDKIIDLMSEQLAGLAIFNIDKDETLILSDKEEVKQYYENKAKELINR